MTPSGHAENATPATATLLPPLPDPPALCDWWLVGPTLGSALWAARHSAKLPAIREKDADFYEHIKRMRVDPSRQSVQNPVPDFYGEKIGSLKQYRQWLRDQATFRRKAAHGLDEP